MTHHGRHSAREPLALALATGQTVRDACHTLGLGERTAYRIVDRLSPYESIYLMMECQGVGA